MDLNEFLRGQQADGVEQGEGSFRIDKSEAARKLASFALPKRTSWVLKLVQAAVGWKCERLDVTRKRFELTFAFCPADPHDIPDVQDFFSTLVTGDLSVAAPLQRFCLALRALVQQNDYSFVLGLKQPDIEPQSLFAGGFVSGLSEEERTALVASEEPGVRVHVSFFKSNESRTGRVLGGLLVGNPREQEVIQELLDSAFLAPSSVRLNKKPLTGLLVHDRWGYGRTHRPLEIAGLNLEGAPVLAGPSELQQCVVAMPTALTRAQRGFGGSREFPGWCVLLWDAMLENDTRPVRAGDLQVCWLQAGVVVHSEIFKTKSSNISALLVVNAEDLECDLTGLSLRDSEARQLREAQAWKEVYRVLGTRLHDLELYLTPQPDEETPAEERAERRSQSHKRSAFYPLFTLPMVAVASINPLLGLGGAVVSMGLVWVSSRWPSEYQTRFGKARYRTLATKCLEALREFTREQVLKRHATEVDEHVYE